jgi:hypothetical protein
MNCHTMLNTFQIPQITILYYFAMVASKTRETTATGTQLAEVWTSVVCWRT